LLWLLADIAPDNDDSGGSNAGIIIAIVVVVAVLAVGFLVMRSRRNQSSQL
jgi:hypothetical protein